MKTNRHSTLLKKAVHLITYNSSHKLICLLGYLLLCSMNTYAQNYVSGTVKDNNGEPLLGVSIKVKDGNIVSGTVTDFNGHYQVKADPSSTIEFSYIGFKTVQFTVGDRKMINVTLGVDDNLLDEVIVVGYGTQKKINLTGSVGVIDSKAFEAIPVSNAVQALQGQVPGLNIYSNQGGGLNQKQSINVRGVGTIGEGSTGSALVLIDGMEGDIYSINPQDIESISVLKDAAASSIYGSRAPFGVILVTTKKGKAGKAQVNYNNSFRVSSPINMPSSLDSYTFSLYYNDAAANSGWGPYNWVSEERINRIKDYMAGKITDSTIPVPNNPSLWADGYSQGNDNIGNFRYVNTYTIANSNGHPAAVPNIMGNKNITWETNGNFNAGVDFEFFKGRLTGTIEYFYRKTSDMLFAFPLPPSFGYTSYYANVGDMRNQGVEAELKGTVINTNNFTWDLGLNLTHYKNKITYLPEERKTMVVDGVGGYSSGSYFYGEGEALYTYRLQQYAGVDQETGKALYWKNIKDENGNVIGRETTAEYSTADYYLCGTALPDIYGGFNTSFSYKGFDLSADFTYQIGGQVYDGDYASMMSSPTKSSKGYNFHADLLNAWTPEHHTNIPRLQYGDTYTTSSSDRFLTNASYLSLQNINFGYTLPASISRRANIEKIRVYLSGDNLWIWSKRQGLDPRQSITGSVTNAYYAPMRTISGGVTLTF